jgi:hypothetical protein
MQMLSEQIQKIVLLDLAQLPKNTLGRVCLRKLRFGGKLRRQCSLTLSREKAGKVFD